jgi:hypothetical protein
MALATLTNVLNYIKVQNIDMKKLQAELSQEALRAKVGTRQRIPCPIHSVCEISRLPSFFLRSLE